MSKYLINKVETYRDDSENQAKRFVEDLKDAWDLKSDIEKQEFLSRFIESKEWIEFREETAFCEMTPQDKKYCINFEDISERILKNVPD